MNKKINIQNILAYIIVIVFIIISLNQLIISNDNETDNTLSVIAASKKQNDNAIKKKSGILSLISEKNLSTKEALYYEKLTGNRVLCLLCPQECLLEENEQGDCRARINVDGKLVSLVYARPVSIALDPIEKKPLYHFYPSNKTLSIATAGCNLHCLNCQNWEISQLNPFDQTNVRVVPPEMLIKYAKESNSNIISYTYSEPNIFYEYILDTAKLAHKNGMKNVMVTAGYINEKPLRALCKYIDAANVDLKGISETFYRSYTTAKLKPVLDVLKIYKEEGVWLEVTNLIIPGANDSDTDIKKLCNWIKDNLGIYTPLHFSRFFPRYKLKNKPMTPANTLLNAYNIAKNIGLKYVYVGNMRTQQYDDTYCPHCGKKIIDRTGYRIESLKIKNNKCMYCGEKIYGRF